MQRTVILPERLAGLLAIVEASSPLSAQDLGVRCGWTTGHTATKLRVLRDLGLVSCANNGNGAKWATPGRAAEHNALRLERRRQANRRAEEKRRRAMFVRPRPASSVFNLAQTA